MANLAIQGHATRGKEVIELLEMLDGNNIVYELDGSDTNAFYYIHHDYIDADHKDMIGEGHPEFKHYTLEEFLEKFPYKIGDKVLYCGNPVFITKMEWIEDSISYHFYYNGRELMLPSKHFQPYKEQETMEHKEFYTIADFTKEPLADKVEIVLGDYELKVEGGKLYAVKKSLEYPKTYERCCEIMGISYPYIGGTEDGIGASTYRIKEARALIQLLICRDAYWKLTGDWKPDWTDNKTKYIITVAENEIYTDVSYIFNYVLSFPTEEMRDAFYENFKDLIEQSKELL